MGCGGSKAEETNQIMGANGPLRKGVRVQTKWDEGRGHDNQWYVGTVEAVYTNGEAKIVYDDPDECTYSYADLVEAGSHGKAWRVARFSARQSSARGKV